MSALKKTGSVFVLSLIKDLGKEIRKLLPVDIEMKTIMPVGKQEKSTNLWEVILADDVIKQLEGAEILVTESFMLRQFMYDIPSLKWVQCTWAGMEPLIQFMDPQKPEPPFAVTRYADMNVGNSLAEYVVGQIINNERKFYQKWESQKQKIWDFHKHEYRILSELTIGIFGAGNLGSTVAKFLKQRGATVLGLVRSAHKTGKPEFDKLVTDFSEILPYCDYICNLLPSTPHTKGLLNGEVLKMCQKKPFFINVGRGDVISEEDLIHALNQGWILGAALDVFIEEPLPTSSPLWNRPEIIITPHVGSLSKAEGVAKFFFENYQRFMTGKELMCKFSWTRRY
ncbi:glyoxylate/hydroxypyruvate reductase A-like isoform X3 [Tachypleus tridentatus]|uniref:glyoxylate/hydroxypyruvate reductase A-like isoform X3 n=1 Tax=Tachypleus tridentatus TaxID=6853 RepID=UPI003FD27D16